MEKILKVEKINFKYETAEILDNVSFEINQGDFVALAGPNGAGKTTLARLILGLESPNSGQIEIFGTKQANNIPWPKIGYLAQRAGLFNPLFPAKVKEVIALGLLSGKKYPKKINSSDKEKIDEVLNWLNISNLKNEAINKLSGGQQQRVFLARALVSKPDLLILDEPSTALDPETRTGFFELLKKLNKERGMAILIITHDTAQAGQYADKLLYLDKRVIFFGQFSDFCHSEEMEKYFGHFAQHLICHQH